MKIKVFKFGGASVKNAEALKNVANIVRLYPDQPLLIVVSAMGKTTNALEQLVHAYVSNEPEVNTILSDIIQYHEDIITELFPEHTDPVFEAFNKYKNKLTKILSDTPGGNYDYDYDQIVCFGELFSSLILSHYLNAKGLPVNWFDARDLLITDSTYREGKIHWDKTNRLIQDGLTILYDSLMFPPVAVTQGFIASNTTGDTTTLGREGSDYTAAIFAHAINAEMVIIWKDVPGLLNADPKYFKDTVLIDKISYKESLELSYYGAGVIHPNTIKPLQNKGIPLYVKSFNEPLAPGTFIGDIEDDSQSNIPCYIFKPDQWLISIASRDFSYITEPALHHIFGIFSSLGIKINLMQNSAISFSVCIDDPQRKMDELINSLKKDYKVRYNEGLRLITIRNYTQEIIDKLVGNQEILLEQKSRYTCQLVVKE